MVYFEYMKSSNKVAAMIAGVVVLAALGWVIRHKWSLSSVLPSPFGTATPTSSPKVTKTPSTAPAGSPLPQSYNDALITYAGHRLQFDQYCQSTPPRLSISKGQKIMLDNRSGDTRTFAVGGVGFTIPGYGWRIMTPTAAKLPATIYVDCGSARNVATIILQ
jgi:hypothetical protein